MSLVTLAQAQTTRYVDDDGSPANGCTSWEDACPDLQTALGLAVVDSGDEIRIAKGTYTPTGPGGSPAATFRLKNGVTLYGGFPDGGGPWESRDPKVHEAKLSGDLNGDDGPNFANNSENSYHVVTGSRLDETAVLDGVTITAGFAHGSSSNLRGGGMTNDRGSPSLIDCTFVRNKGSFGGGMYNGNSSHPTLIRCKFVENYGAGFHNDRTCHPIFQNCDFINNAATGVSNYSDSALTNCRFIGNASGMYNGGGRPVLTN